MVRFLELRKQHNLTQCHVADILGVTRQAYSRYELGERELGYLMLLKLAEYYKVSIDYLLGRADEVGLSPFDELDTNESNYKLDNGLTLGEDDLLQRYRYLDDRNRILLVNYAMELCNEQARKLCDI